MNVFKVNVNKVPIKQLFDKAFLGNLATSQQDLQVSIPLKIEVEYDLINSVLSAG